MLLTKKIRLTSVMKGTWQNLVFLCAICVVAYFFDEHILKKYFEFPPIIPAIMGPALAFFIGFNNDQAYDRWWEARKIWGALVNDSRTWARQLICYLANDNSEVEEEIGRVRKRAIYRHIAFLYALKEKLRGDVSKDYKKYLSSEEFAAVELKTNIHNAILTEQSRDLEYLYKNGWVDGFKFIELNKIIVSFCDEMGKSERIKNTIFPSSYIFYTRIFIWFFIVSITFVFTNFVGAWAILFGIMIGYVFIVTHAVGLTIINPFEPIPSGIPMDQIARTIEINLLEALGETDIPEPIKSVNDEYIM